MPQIEELPAHLTLTPELTALITELDQTRWMAFSAPWHLSNHVLVALDDDRSPTGFLRYVVQAIGVEEDRPPFTLHGKELREAKVIAFGVHPAHRRRGIGRALQERLIAACRAAGLYQIRSHSSDLHPENQALKADLGFGIHPLPAGGGRDGCYFILPLRPHL